MSADRGEITADSGCVGGRVQAICSIAATCGGGRVGAPELDALSTLEAIALAVAASVCRVDTRYDERLIAGSDRGEARERVRPDVEWILDRRRKAPGAGRAS